MLNALLDCLKLGRRNSVTSAEPPLCQALGRDTSAESASSGHITLLGALEPGGLDGGLHLLIRTTIVQELCNALEHAVLVNKTIGMYKKPLSAADALRLIN